MKPFIFIAILLLVGCGTTVPVVMKFPEVPEELKKTCPDLKLAEPSPRLSDMLKTVTQNYELYKECQIKNETWLEWYNSQQKIFDSIK